MQQSKFDELVHKSFIGRYEIDHKICEDLLQYYNENRHLAFPGETGSGSNRLVKESMDISLRPDGILTSSNDKYPDERVTVFIEELNHSLDKYKNRYSLLERIPTRLTEFNVQEYPPGGGFRSLHCERSCIDPSQVCRLLVWMTYLNDVPDGGTHFHYQGLTTEAVKGHTLIWPADWTHSHRGIPSPNHIKTIATGWIELC